MQKHRARVMTFLASFFICLILCADDPATQETGNLGLLQKVYDQKRTDVLKSVMAEYEIQLETLQKKMTQKGNLDGAVTVRKELDDVKERAAFVVRRSAPNTKEPDELSRLRRAHQQKRVDALKPVMTVYENQLVALQKKLTQKNDLDEALLVRNELEALKKSFVVELSWELTRSLLETSWSWTGEPRAKRDKGVEMIFYDDGTVSHRGMRGTWHVTGPREILILESNTPGKYVLRFDSKFTAYEQAGGPIHGRRWQ